MVKKRKLKRGPGRGGPRPNSGRPRKMDSEQFGQITTVLRRETIAKLKAGAGSKFVGEYLQFHLDRQRLLSHEEYIAARENQPVEIVLRGRKREVLVSAGAGRRPKRMPKAKSEADLRFLKAYAALEDGK